MRVILGVGGGIAAYKVASLLRLFTEDGHHVTVIPTESAAKFVGVATWEALSGNPVSNSVFDDVEQVNHVRLGHEADLIVVAPATADLLARAAAGLANDLLTNTLLMASGPVVFVPAMHSEMWAHPATVANVATLRGRGAIVMEPATGRLTGSDSGPGRLPEPADIYAFIRARLSSAEVPPETLLPKTPLAETLLPETLLPETPLPETLLPETLLAGTTVTITAGGTREPLDPVRFLGNRSSGKQGVALAVAAQSAGAEVRLIAAHMDVAPPPGIKVTAVETALELREAALAAADASDVVIMAAAVADFRPAQAAGTKIKKRDDVPDPVITLVRNPDILAELVARRGDSGTPALIVGFAAETGDAESDVLQYALAKLRRKGCDLLVLNQVGTDRVFGRDETDVVVLSRSGAEPQAVTGTKTAVAEAIVRRIAVELAATK